MKWTLVPISEFSEYRHVWQKLCGRSTNTPLLDCDFIEPLISEFSNGHERIAIGETDAEIKAMAILSQERFGVWQTFQPSQAPLGAWIAADVGWNSALGSLVRALPGLAIVVGVTQQDPLFAVRPANGGHVETLDYIQTAYVSVRGRFEEYWRARGKNLRHNMKRQRSRLERDGIVPRLELISTAGDVGKAVEAYGRLESAGWKAQATTEIHPDNAQGRFYTAMLTRFATTGATRIYQYWYGEKLVATDLCLQRDGVLIILKTTYDESQTGTSPALLMREESFAQIFADGKVRRIEFYGKLMDWHTKWSDEIRTLYHINCYRWSFLPRLFRRKRIAGNWTVG